MQHTFKAYMLTFWCVIPFLWWSFCRSRQTPWKRSPNIPIGRVYDPEEAAAPGEEADIMLANPSVVAFFFGYMCVPKFNQRSASRSSQTAPESRRSRAFENCWTWSDIHDRRECTWLKNLLVASLMRRQCADRSGYRQVVRIRWDLTCALWHSVIFVSHRIYI